MSGPLSHVKVLDLSRVMAGPWAGQILADLGADVIKVERPGAGDDTRAWGPPFLQDEDGDGCSDAGYYLCVNRGKRSFTVDLAHPEGQELIRKLAARSDIVLENYKVGTLTRFGLDYAGLRAVNPAIIYCSVTGFGQTGPRAKLAAYDFAIQAMGGLMSITGEREGLPGGGPQKVGVPIMDLTTGMYAAVAVLAALANRDQTGEGDYIDLSMLDVATAFLANQGMNHLLTGKVPQRAGNRHPNIAPQDVFECRGGKLVLAIGNDGQYAKLCRILGRPELGTDERYAKNPSRVANLLELLTIIRDLIAPWQVDELVAALDAAGVPCGRINNVAEALAQPQVVHRGMVQHLPHPRSGTVPQVVSPLRFENAPLSYTRHPPLFGEHGSEILRELGIDEADEARLREMKIV